MFGYPGPPPSPPGLLSATPLGGGGAHHPPNPPYPPTGGYAESSDAIVLLRRRPVSLKIGPQSQSKNPPTPPLLKKSPAPPPRPPHTHPVESSGAPVMRVPPPPTGGVWKMGLNAPPLPPVVQVADYRTATGLGPTVATLCPPHCTGPPSREEGAAQCRAVPHVHVLRPREGLRGGVSEGGGRWCACVPPR